jgi:hypothetical protein
MSWPEDFSSSSAWQVPRFPFGVEAIGDVERVGVDFDHAVQRRPAAIDRVDAGQIEENLQYSWTIPGTRACERP